MDTKLDFLGCRSGNQISASGARQLLQSITKNRILIRVQLEGNPIDDPDVIHSVGQVLDRNRRRYHALGYREGDGSVAPLSPVSSPMTSSSAPSTLAVMKRTWSPQSRAKSTRQDMKSSSQRVRSEKKPSPGRSRMTGDFEDPEAVDAKSSRKKAKVQRKAPSPRVSDHSAKEQRKGSREELEERKAEFELLMRSMLPAGAEDVERDVDRREIRTSEMSIGEFDRSLEEEEEEEKEGKFILSVSWNRVFPHLLKFWFLHWLH
jgi:hypothetical protein